MPYKIHISYSGFYDALDIYIMSEHMDKHAICTDPANMIFKELEDPTERIEPTITVSRLIAQPLLQAFADALHKHGIRAEGEPVLENELTATKYHLEDMRRLIFNKREMEELEQQRKESEIK